MPVLPPVASLKLSTDRLPFSVPPSASLAPATPTQSLAAQTAYLGWILIRRGWITVAQLERTLLVQQTNGAPIGSLLLQDSLLTPEQLDIALKEQFWRRKGYWVI
ncbi:MAG: hypothetical protein ACAF41_34770 (plasmid) [Leptolyngbya sp. BL-A-14]